MPGRDKILTTVRTAFVHTCCYEQHKKKVPPRGFKKQLDLLEFLKDISPVIQEVSSVLTIYNVHFGISSFYFEGKSATG